MDVPTRDTVAAVAAVAREKRITADAANLAFYAFNVLVALAVLVYVTFTLFGPDNALSNVLQTLTGVGAGAFRRFFQRAGSNAAGRRRATVLAAVISMWSSLRLFWAVETVFTEIYEIRRERSLRRQFLDSVAVLAAVTLTMVAMASVGTLFLFRTSGLVWVVLGPPLLWLSLLVLFFPLYYTFSGDVSAVEILPGTALAAAGWTVSAIGLRVYVVVSESVDFYGVVGAVLLVLTWLYVVGLSMLLGGILNALLADRIEASEDWYLFDR